MDTVADAFLRTTIVSDDGTRLSLARGRDGGPPVLVVPGSLATADDWRPVVDQFVGATGYVLDRRGHGRSEPGRASHGIAREVEDAITALRYTRPVALVGHSYGGVVALLTAVERPDLVPALFLIEPALAIDEPIGGPIIEHVERLIGLARLDDALALGLRRFVGLDDAEIADRRGGLRWAAMRALLHTWPAEVRELDRLIDRQASFAGLRMPVSIAYGASTAQRFIRGVRAVADVLPAATIGVFPGEGHSSFASNPRLVAEFIAQAISLGQERWRGRPARAAIPARDSGTRQTGDGGRELIPSLPAGVVLRSVDP